MKFRAQRGGYEESMATVFEFSTRAELLEHVQRLYSLPTVYLPQMIVSRYCERDTRNGWVTYLVWLPNIGVVGFTDGPVPEEK